MKTNATHMAGGELTYTHISGNTYEFTLKLYRDCSGAMAPGNTMIKLNSISLGQNLNFAAPLDTIIDYSSYCSNVLTTCNGGIMYGHQLCIYKATYTLPAAAPDWLIFAEVCCRNITIDNLDSPGSNNICVWNRLNNTLNTPWNNSPKFVIDNGLIFNTGQTYTINHTDIDQDGDSLNYSLAQPVNSITNGVFQYINYLAGYNYLSPLNGSISINNLNGNLTFNSNLQGEYVVVIKIDEYRNGILIGSIIRDLQLAFYVGTANALPQLSGINGGKDYFKVHKVCLGNPLTFTVNSFDPDINDSIKINYSTYNIPNANITVSNAAQPTATFTWYPTLADIRPQPYILGLEARDNHCFLNGIQSFGYLIYLIPCNTDTVWPGDANSDYVVNNYDLLNIGLAFNTSGVVRPGATTNWTAQYCASWTDTFVNGINYKHADCDGNGIIDNADVNVVSLNYGNFHLKTHQIGKYKSRRLPDLFFNTNGIQAIPGTSIQIPIHLGSNGSPMNNIYGIAGKILVSNTLSNSITIDNTNCWIGNNNE